MKPLLLSISILATSCAICQDDSCNLGESASGDGGGSISLQGVPCPDEESPPDAGAAGVCQLGQECVNAFCVDIAYVPCVSPTSGEADGYECPVVLGCSATTGQCANGSEARVAE